MAFETRVHQEFQVRPPRGSRMETLKYLILAARDCFVLVLSLLAPNFFPVSATERLPPAAQVSSSSSAAFASRGVSGDALPVPSFAATLRSLTAFPLPQPLRPRRTPCWRGCNSCNA